MSSNTPLISVIIPANGDRDAWVTLVERLWLHDPPPDEIVVVDGGNSVSCRSLARRLGCLYLATRAGRGNQLHAGALRANGDVLWFLHADATPPDRAIPLIRTQHRSGAIGGYFPIRFAGGSAWYKVALASLTNFRVRFGVPYGEHGLFASRTAYERAGGFADLPLFGEVPLVRGLRHQGRFVRVDAVIGVSPRHWDREGWLWRAVTGRALAVAHALGVPAARLAPRYRPPVR